jgi:N-acetylneuraminate synthase
MRHSDGKCYIVAEAGINHNGSLDLAKAMVQVAKKSGADCIKFQKRTVEAVYTPEELARPRISAFGETNGALKRGLEFTPEEYREIAKYAEEVGIDWAASVWDVRAAEEIADVVPKTAFLKIASPSLTNGPLVKRVAELCRQHGLECVMSTGMSSDEEIDGAAELFREVAGEADLTLLQCTSAYPCPPSEANVGAMRMLAFHCSSGIGFSGHCPDIFDACAAAAAGAGMIEKHFTLANSLWGSDQSWSLSPSRFREMVQVIRHYELLEGPGTKKVLDCEKPAMEKLRRG